jgi:zeaxanthin glucosyltransferase
VAEASAMAPEWFFVLHISDPALIGAFASAANLLVVSWIPQLTLLRHTAVMVHHGGLNSIMECVQREVPMVILPCARDQPGNAVRAAHHQLALTADVRTITGARLRPLIGKAMGEAALKRGLRRMKDQIEHERGLEQAVALIEDVSAGFVAGGISDRP